MEKSKLFSTPELSTRFRAQTVARWRRQALPPAPTRIGRRHLWPAQDVEALRAHKPRETAG
jgi:hypothetical protein